MPTAAVSETAQVSLTEFELFEDATTASVVQASAVPSATFVMPKLVAVATADTGAAKSCVCGRSSVQAAVVPEVVSTQVPGSVKVAAGLSAHTARYR